VLGKNPSKPIVYFMYYKCLNQLYTRCFCESCTAMRTALFLLLLLLLLLVCSIICLVFIIETECVYCEVWTESLNKFEVTFHLWMAAANTVRFSYSVTKYCSKVPSLCAYNCVTWINIGRSSISLLTQLMYWRLPCNIR
jgi:hypothetical protein